MTINATLINYLHLCYRKLWLHANVIRMEHTSEVVSEGKLIGEESYPQRADKNQELEISYELHFPSYGITVGCSAKIDFFDTKLGVVHETKKSSAKEFAHEAQVKFYLYLLRKNEIEANYGILEYPKFRHTERVELHEDEYETVESWIWKAYQIATQEDCPAALAKSKCKNCSYFEFCWSGEEDV
ncbi:MAG: CRISPR-associated protein Cas4 [Chitinophagales bacterium]|jgi:CRISPR-associated exonuclease Cas4|nr:CRISPR-associated protein Cas4 [Chitinophagales bacterium]